MDSFKATSLRRTRNISQRRVVDRAQEAIVGVSKHQNWNQHQHQQHFNDTLLDPELALLSNDLLSV